MFQGFLMYLLFLIPPLLFMVYAQYKVTSTYNKYSKVANMQRMSGAQAAQVLFYDGDFEAAGGAPVWRPVDSAEETAGDRKRG